MEKYFSFYDYFQLNENLLKLNKKTGEIQIKTKDGSDIFALKNLVKIGKETIKKKKDIWDFIKKNSYEFSLPLIILSLIIMGINVQNFINQNPDILQYGPEISPDKIQESLNIAINFLKNNLAFIRSIF